MSAHTCYTSVMFQYLQFLLKTVKIHKVEQKVYCNCGRNRDNSHILEKSQMLWENIPYALSKTGQLSLHLLVSSTFSLLSKQICQQPYQLNTHGLLLPSFFSYFNNDWRCCPTVIYLQKVYSFHTGTGGLRWIHGVHEITHRIQLWIASTFCGRNITIERIGYSGMLKNIWFFLKRLNAIHSKTGMFFFYCNYLCVYLETLLEETVSLLQYCNTVYETRFSKLKKDGRAQVPLWRAL